MIKIYLGCIKHISSVSIKDLTVSKTANLLKQRGKKHSG